MSGVWNSAVASQPCPSGHITADKRLRYAFPKLPSATSFIRITLSEIASPLYSPPNIDFITLTPKNEKILDKKLNKTKWDKVLPAIKEVYANVPVFAFIDWSFDESPTVMFSQKLSKEWRIFRQRGDYNKACLCC